MSGSPVDDTTVPKWLNTLVFRYIDQGGKVADQSIDQKQAKDGAASEEHNEVPLWHNKNG